MVKDSVLERLFGVSLREIAKELGIDYAKLERFDRELSRDFWKKVNLREVYSAKLKYPETYMLKLMERYTFAHYGASSHATKKSLQRVVEQALKNKHALKNLHKIPREKRVQEALRKGLLPETTFPYTRAYLIEHEELGPIGFAGINPGKIHELSMLVVHPIGSNKDLEEMMGGKLRIGSVLMLYTLFKHKRLQLLANNRSLGVIQKLKKELGLRGFRIVRRGSPLIEFSEVVYNRPKKKVK